MTPLMLLAPRREAMRRPSCSMRRPFDVVRMSRLARARGQLPSPIHHLHHAYPLPGHRILGQRTARQAEPNRSTEHFAQDAAEHPTARAPNTFVLARPPRRVRTVTPREMAMAVPAGDCGESTGMRVFLCGRRANDCAFSCGACVHTRRMAARRSLAPSPHRRRRSRDGMWRHVSGTGSDVWKRIAAPMASGIFTVVLELVVYPAIDELWKWHFEMKSAAAQPQLARSSPCRRPKRRADRAQTLHSSLIRG
jgi:hypothetical protein